MTDLTERLLTRLRELNTTDDHARGCQGREYHCSCDYDIRVENAVFEAIAALETLTQENARLDRDRELAIKWANQSVSMLQSTFFPVADALRDLEAYLAYTPHHNAPEAAAARKVLRAFDACEVPPAPARKALGGGDANQA
ncbi:hypothetical protein ACQKJZ_04600 [Sphingomonas sp. NPDC019816]|uniref:hypothetical protein n=1 Tax=Sphingomonas sp. NPDC019816 TaxID=3390679 RepID=UPI003D01318D